MMMHRRKTALALASVALALTLTGCATTQGPKSIAQTAATNPELSTLAKLLKDAGLVDTLNGTGPFTVFAPTNAAFAAVPAATLQKLAADPQALRGVLTYHVLPGLLTADDIKTGPMKTVNGANVALSKAGTFVTVEEAVVTQANVSATNGVVHVIDQVLIPPRPAAARAAAPAAPR